MKSRKSGFGLLLLALITLASLVSKEALAVNDKLGINVSPPQKFTSSLPFVDLFKLSTGWVTSCEFDWQRNRPIDPGCTRKNSFNTKEKDQVQLDANGWVRSLPSRNAPQIYTSVSSLWTLPDSFPTRDYVVLYEGQGEMAVRGDITIKNERPGRIDFHLDSTKRNLRLHITKTSRNYIRNIRVIPKEYELSYRSRVFNPQYVNKIAPFNVLRFMPWMQTAYQQDVSWNTRARPTSAHYTATKGVPIETMIDLANQTRSAPWFNIPHKANDGYIHNFANLVKARLQPGQKVYVELSNEVWNGLYTATHYAHQQARLLWPRAYPKMNPGTRKLLLAINWYGKRSTEMCNIWKRSFGTQKNRVICVLSTYASSQRFGRELLDCPLWMPDGKKGECGRNADAFAVGPYFGDYMARIENRNTIRAWANQGDGGMNSIFREILQGDLIKDKYKGGAIQRAVEVRIKPNVALAKEYGLPLIAYEGGQHLLRVDPPHTLKDPRLLEMFMKANRDPRMKTAYLRYLQAWRQQGGKLMVHFYGIGETDPRNFFSMLEHVGQHTSPKYQALLQYLR